MSVRTNRTIVLSLPLIAVLACSSAAYAEEPAREGPTFGIGARVGGYGFREVKEDALSWQDCRMDGAGLFGTLDLGRHFFGELSADLYHATAGPVSEGMDRSSFHTLAAIGVRILPGYLVTPYIQAGGGSEFTRIDIEDTSEKMVLPEGFMGVGGELHWKSLHFGSTLRVASMGLPVHTHGERASQDEVHQHLESDATAIPVRQRAAGHLLFTLRYTF